MWAWRRSASLLLMQELRKFARDVRLAAEGASAPAATHGARVGSPQKSEGGFSARASNATAGNLFLAPQHPSGGVHPVLQHPGSPTGRSPSGSSPNSSPYAPQPAASPSREGRPGLVWTGRHWLVAWADRNGETWQVVIQRFDANGEFDGTRYRVSLPNGSGTWPSISWAGDRLGVAWLDNIGGNNDLYFVSGRFDCP